MYYHSSYTWLYNCNYFAAEQENNKTIDWWDDFGTSSALMPDGSTHFRNETLRLVSKGLHSHYHFDQLYFRCNNVQWNVLVNKSSELLEQKFLSHKFGLTHGRTWYLFLNLF